MQVFVNLRVVMSSQTLLNAKVCRWIVERTFGISLKLIQKNLTRQLPRSKGCVTVYRYFFLFGTADCGLRTADCGLRTADSGLRTASAVCSPATAHCGLRTTDCGIWIQTVEFGLRNSDCRLCDCRLRPAWLGYRQMFVDCGLPTTDWV